MSTAAILHEDPTTRNPQPFKQIVAVSGEHDVFVAGQYVGSRRFRHQAEQLAAETAERYLRAAGRELAGPPIDIPDEPPGTPPGGPEPPDYEAASWSSAPGGAKVRSAGGWVTWMNTSALGGGAL